MRCGLALIKSAHPAFVSPFFVARFREDVAAPTPLGFLLLGREMTPVLTRALVAVAN